MGLVVKLGDAFHRDFPGVEPPALVDVWMYIATLRDQGIEVSRALDGFSVDVIFLDQGLNGGQQLFARIGRRITAGILGLPVPGCRRGRRSRARGCPAWRSDSPVERIHEPVAGPGSGRCPFHVSFLGDDRQLRKKGVESFDQDRLRRPVGAGDRRAVGLLLCVEGSVAHRFDVLACVAGEETYLLEKRTERSALLLRKLLFRKWCLLIHSLHRLGYRNRHLHRYK